MPLLGEDEDPTRAPEYTPNFFSLFNQPSPENNAIGAPAGTHGIDNNNGSESISGPLCTRPGIQKNTNPNTRVINPTPAITASPACLSNCSSPSNTAMCNDANCQQTQNDWQTPSPQLQSQLPPPLPPQLSPQLQQRPQQQMLQQQPHQQMQQQQPHQQLQQQQQQHSQPSHNLQMQAQSRPSNGHLEGLLRYTEHSQMGQPPIQINSPPIIPTTQIASSQYAHMSSFPNSQMRAMEVNESMRPMGQSQRHNSFPGSYNSDHMSYANAMQPPSAHNNVITQERQQPLSELGPIYNRPSPTSLVNQQLLYAGPYSRQRQHQFQVNQMQPQQLQQQQGSQQFNQQPNGHLQSLLQQPQQVFQQLYSGTGFQHNYAQPCNPNMSSQAMLNSPSSNDPSNHVALQNLNTRFQLRARVTGHSRPRINSPQIALIRTSARSTSIPPATQTTQVPTQTSNSTSQAPPWPQIALNSVPSSPPVNGTQNTVLPTTNISTEQNLSNIAATSTAPKETTTTITTTQTSASVSVATSVPSITPVSVSSTTRQSGTALNQTEDSPRVDTVVKANKACQVRVSQVVVVNRCTNTDPLPTTTTEDKECQTDFVEKKEEIKTYVDRASSPIPFNALVRFKITPKRRKITQQEDSDTKSDEEVINVIE